MIGAPASTEFNPAFARYVGLVANVADPVRELAEQRGRMLALLSPLSDEQAQFRYAPDKWSIKTLVNHLSDAERVFAYRMMRVGRGDSTPLPSFDENDYASAAHSDQRPFTDLLGEWSAVREATAALARNLPVTAWRNEGVSTNGSPITPRALLYIVLGHTEHHLAVLAERYGVGPA